MDEGTRTAACRAKKTRSYRAQIKLWARGARIKNLLDSPQGPSGCHKRAGALLQSSSRVFNRSLPIRQAPPVVEGVVRGWCDRRRSKRCCISFSLAARCVDQSLIGRPPQSEVFIEASLE